MCDLCVRFYIISYSVLFGLLGMSLLSAGFATKLSVSASLTDFLGEQTTFVSNNMLNAAFLLALVTGSFMVLMALIGLIGAGAKIKSMLVIFLIVHSFFFVLELCFVVYKSIELSEVLVFSLSLLAVDMITILSTVYLIRSIDNSLAKKKHCQTELAHNYLQVPLKEIK